MRHTGGTWDPKEDPFYFIASNVSTLVCALKSNRKLLIAVNEIATEHDIAQLEQWVESGMTVFVDSGVFNLVNRHAEKHDMTMDQALSIPPDQVDGFDELFSKYCKLIERIGHKVWGYIEIDVGGRENKIKTRARLEALGFSPIPVYHPMNDGWEYFDYLAERYDRICFGNLVMADPATRKRLLATAWERRRKYPNLWIHCLGVTPNEMANAFPLNSCDSSSWINMVRWGGTSGVTCALKSFGGFPQNMMYAIGSDHESETGYKKARAAAGYIAHFATDQWRALLREYRDVLGCDHGLYLK